MATIPIDPERFENLERFLVERERAQASLAHAQLRLTKINTQLSRQIADLRILHNAPVQTHVFSEEQKAFIDRP